MAPWLQEVVKSAELTNLTFEISAAKSKLAKYKRDRKNIIITINDLEGKIRYLEKRAQVLKS